MKLQISVIVLAVCSTCCVYGHKAIVIPPGGMRCVTKTFEKQREAVLKKNLYLPSNIDPKYEGCCTVSEIYQVNEPAADHTKLLAEEGWGLNPGKMTHYRFSLIGNNQNCTIGFTNREYFNSERVFILGLDLSKGEFVRNKRFSIGRIELDNDLENVDWFLEFYRNGLVMVRVSLNGEPMTQMFKIPFDNDPDVRPLLYCEGPMDSAKAIAVTQYSPRLIVENKPYSLIHNRYELKNPGAFLPKEIAERLEKFPADFSVKIKIEDDVIEMHVVNTIICNLKLHATGEFGTERKICMISMNNVEEPYSSLEKYLGRIIMSSTDIRRKSSGNVEVIAEGLRTLEFTRRVYTIKK